MVTGITQYNYRDGENQFVICKNNSNLHTKKYYKHITGSLNLGSSGNGFYLRFSY